LAAVRRGAGIHKAGGGKGWVGKHGQVCFRVAQRFQNGFICRAYGCQEGAKLGFYRAAAFSTTIWCGEWKGVRV